MPYKGSPFRACFQTRGQFCICNCFIQSQSLVLGVQIPLTLFCQSVEAVCSSSGQYLRGHIYLSVSKGMHFKYPFFSSPGNPPNSLLFRCQIVFLQMGHVKFQERHLTLWQQPDALQLPEGNYHRLQLYMYIGSRFTEMSVQLLFLHS